MSPLQYPFGNDESTLSRVLINADDASKPDCFRLRKCGELLRPIYIDGRSVGICRGRQCDTIHVRGITSVLWHFISRGHRAKVIMPHFVVEELDNIVIVGIIELHRLLVGGFIDFVYGRDSTHERHLVDERLANEANHNGGCIVTSNSLSILLKRRPTLANVIDNRLLIPSFDYDGTLKFAVDTNGRRGPYYRDVIRCNYTTDDASMQLQMDVELQRQYLQYLADIIDDDDWHRQAALIGTPNISLELISSMEFHKNEQRMLRQNGRRQRCELSTNDECDGERLCTYWNIGRSATIDHHQLYLSFPSIESHYEQHVLFASLVNIFDRDTAIGAVRRWPDIINLDEMLENIFAVELIP